MLYEVITDDIETVADRMKASGPLFTCGQDPTMTITALIPAAGAGRRMAANVNKQYLELAGRPVLAHTLAVFEHHPAIDRIVIVAPAEELAFCRNDIVAPGGFSKVTSIVAGGAERQDS